MSRPSRIASVLGAQLFPSYLLLVDASEGHKHHRNNPGGEETHIELSIRSELLSGLSLVQSHRKINSLIQSEFDSGLHSLNIKILS